MSLAQVVYKMSIDNEFASRWNLDPETALAEKGLQFSREELAFLTSGLHNGRPGEEGQVQLADLAMISRGWK